MDKKIIIFLLVFIILAGGIWYWGSISQKSADEDMAINEKADIILFYGRECPHCKDVEEFIEKNGIREKVSFENVEVWHNKENARIILEKAKECGQDEKTLAVPFLYVRGKCLTGAPDIEEFFKKEAGL